MNGWKATVLLLASSACFTELASAQCSGNCGGSAGGCFCDSFCTFYNDCCQDYNQVVSARGGRNKTHMSFGEGDSKKARVRARRE